MVERTMKQRYKTFPPSVRHLRIPVASRRAALAGIALYPACRPRASRAQRLAWELVTWFGPRALPGRSRPWSPPLPMDTWRRFLLRWRDQLGPFDAIAVHQRSQLDRSGFGVLLLDGGDPVSFIKIRHDPELGEHEWRILEAVTEARPRSFSAPAPEGKGWNDGWHWLAVSPIPSGIHGVPVRPPLKEIVRDIRDSLAGLPRDSKAPTEWKPMHGDLAPWNLRQLTSGRLVLLDWERAGYGPPGADRVYYLACEAALKGFRPLSPEDRSAADYWLRSIDSGTSGRRDARLTASLRRALADMSQASGGTS